LLKNKVGEVPQKIKGKNGKEGVMSWLLTKGAKTLGYNLIFLGCTKCHKSHEEPF
jgi:hypothetical protein